MIGEARVLEASDEFLPRVIDAAIEAIANNADLLGDLDRAVGVAAAVGDFDLLAHHLPDHCRRATRHFGRVGNDHDRDSFGHGSSFE